VSVTYTLNFSYGSRRMVAGTGILLNNEMDDFNVVPGVANAYGLPADEANGLAPGKRMLSSMTPVIAFLPDGGVLATGSPGGSRIPTTVLQVLVNVIDHKMNVAEATHTPRIHHQWQPDVLYYERGISLDTVDILKAMGHNLSLQAAMGSTQTILWRDGVFRGAADPRRREAAVVGVE
jgi:gamma-glutamyltranspeptidase/glutathione hydrolase